MYALIIAMPAPADHLLVTEFEHEEAAQAAVKAIAEIAPRAQCRIVEDAPRADATPEIEHTPAEPKTTISRGRHG
jgi:hypothetical protein